MNEFPVPSGSVLGQVRIWLRAEGVSVFALSVLLYRNSGWSWWLFFLLLLTPDLAMIPYLINPRIGGACYNVIHSYLLPLGLAIVVIASGRMALLPYLYIWVAHIGMDRCLGYGLKYPTAFGRTHLGHLTSRRSGLVGAVGV